MSENETPARPAFHIGDRVLLNMPAAMPHLSGLCGEIVRIETRLPGFPYVVKPDGKAYMVYCRTSELIPLAPAEVGP